jgi:WhiB family redox-sensing transcriptional regulator
MSDTLLEGVTAQTSGAEPDWRVRGACLDLDPDDFFPVGNERALVRQYENARRACRACSVSTQCLQFALDSHTDFGMWGGYTPRERQRMRGRRDHAEDDRRALFGRGGWAVRADDALSTTHMATADAVPGARTPVASAR